MRFTIARYSDDKTTRIVFEFSVTLDYAGSSVALDSYHESTRETRRHGWKIKDKWGTFDRRTNTMDQPTEIPSDVAAELLEEITNHVKKVPITAGHRRNGTEIGKF